jgi:N,N'-diacetyllegionaminate synthase
MSRSAGVARGRCFVIAEAGVNHDGSADVAHRLIDVAADSGADAVKFQTFDPKLVAAASADAAPYQRQRGIVDQTDMLRTLQLPRTVWPELAAHARDRTLTFLSTAFDAPSLDLLLELGMTALKSPSGELDNLAFIQRLAGCGLPLILSTGMGTMEEVAAAVDAANGAPALHLLHCVTAYPTPPEACNLRAITTMARRFELPVGWSDHTDGMTTAVAAVALGASMLEKHLTLDRSRSGPDHAASSDPRGFAVYVSAVRDTESALGDGVKVPQDVELINRQHARRSFHAVSFLHEGQQIGAADVTLLRPAVGLPPASDVIGRTLTRPVSAGAPIVAADLR